MSKKFTNVVDRGRVVSNKYNLVNNGDGTALITDIENNINVQGTPLDKNLFNPMQEGLIFTVETTHTIENGTDVYELDIDGLQGVNNLNGLPLFNGLSLNIKVNKENTTNVVKVKISGNKYDLAKENNDTLENLKIGELKNKYHKIIYNGVRFVLFTGVGLEYSKWLETIGGQFGGYVSKVANKEAGKLYINDVYDNKLYVCVTAHSSTSFDITKYRDITNNGISNKLENLSEIRILKNAEIESRLSLYFEGCTLTKLGNIVIFNGYMKKNYNNYINSTGVVLFKLPYPPKGETWVEPFFTIRQNGDFEVGAHGAFNTNKITEPRHINFVYVCQN